MDRHHFSISLHHHGRARLSEAILIYRGAGVGSCQSYATIHAIDHSGTAPVILPGHAATTTALLGLSRALSDSVRHSGFIPNTVLYADGDSLVWWVPPGLRHIAFRCAQWQPNERAGTLPHPGLVFLCDKQRWMVWAVKGRCRPTPETILWRAPYFNVYVDGNICRGNITLPNTNSFDNIAQWNDAFFRTYFTHSNTPGNLLDYTGGAYAFWRDMLDRPVPRFPNSVLVRLGMRLKDIIHSKEKNHA